MLFGHVTAGGPPGLLAQVHARALRCLGEAASWRGCFEVRPGELATALDGLRALGFGGASLAPGHQREAVAQCKATPLARTLGRASFVRFGPEGAEVDDALAPAIQVRLAALAPDAREVLVLGLGPAAAASLVAARSAGAARIWLAASNHAGAARLLQRLAPELGGAALELATLDALPAARLAIHAGDPETDAALRPLQPSRIPALLELGTSQDALPPLLAQWRAEGGSGEDGTLVAVRAGLLMLERWRGAPVDAAVERRVAAALRAGTSSARPVASGAQASAEPRASAVGTR